MSDVRYIVCMVRCTSYVCPRYVVRLMYHCWTLGYVGEGFLSPGWALGYIRRKNNGVCDVGGTSDVVWLLGDLINNWWRPLEECDVPKTHQM